MEPCPDSKIIRGQVKTEQLIAMCPGPSALWLGHSSSCEAVLVSGERVSGLRNAYARREPRFSRTGS